MRTAVCALLLLIAGPGSAGAQAPPSREHILATARAIAATARYATLMTVANNAVPHGRIVDPLALDDDLTIHVATVATSRKVQEIARNPRVSLLYFDAAGGSYVTFSGRAAFVRDAAEKQRKWKPEWSPFYPGGPGGTDTVLFRIKPSRLEIVSPAAGINNDPRTWRAVTLDLTK